MKRYADNCMYAIPHELSGIGTVCALFQNVCNRLGKRCLGYTAHTAESRKELEAALEARRLKKKGGAE